MVALLMEMIYSHLSILFAVSGFIVGEVARLDLVLFFVGGDCNAVRIQCYTLNYVFLSMVCFLEYIASII